MPTLTNYHWDLIDDCVLSETDQNANTIATYTHAPGQFGPLLSENRGGAEYYHHYDALGSTTFLTSDAGTVTDTFLYDAWETSVARTGTTPTPYQWNGRWGYQYDVLAGDYYVRARTYRPDVARWTSVDPWSDVSVPGDLYSYSLSSPLAFNDASGLWPLCSSSFCSRQGPRDTFEGYYGLRAELIAAPNECCNGKTVRFTYKESHALAEWDTFKTKRIDGKFTGCGEPGNSEINRGDIFPVTFGNVLKRGCTKPIVSMKQLGQAKCWVIQIQWECQTICTGGCGCSGNCSPGLFELGIYPRVKKWGFSILLQTAITYDEFACYLNGCTLNSTLTWLPQEQEWANPFVSTDNCSDEDRQFLWSQ